MITLIQENNLFKRTLSSLRRLAAQELAAATRSEVVQVIGTKFVLYRESHSKPKEKRIELVKPSKKKKA